jgi:hypothetical protein
MPLALLVRPRPGAVLVGGGRRRRLPRPAPVLPQLLGPFLALLDLHEALATFSLVII